MPRPQPRSWSRQIQSLFAAGTLSGLSDRELLDRFLARGDTVAEMAFAVLVERHGPMVLGVCRRILGDPHDAEDAFQATFLVLVKRAHSVRVDGSLGRWLFGAATRVASRARFEVRRRHAREHSGCEHIEVTAPAETTTAAELAELRSIVAEELARLPAGFRSALATCDLEGATHEEAARRLGVPVGTVKSRLARARARLHRRLARRGLNAPDLAIAAPLFAAAVPLELVQTTARAGSAVSKGAAAVVSPRVAALTENALQTMFFSKLKLAAGALLALVAASAVVFSKPPAPKPQEPPQPIAGAAAPAVNPAATAAQTDPGDEEVEVGMLDRAWADAIPRRDTAFVNRILADDFTGIDPAANTFTKASYLQDVASGAFSLDRIQLDAVKPRVFGDVAVVTSLIKINGQPTGGRMTNVYVKRQGRWRCVSSHASGRTDPFGMVPAPGFGPETIRTARASSVLLRLWFPCRIEQIFVRVGQTVKQRDRLLSAHSGELAAVKSRLREQSATFQRNKRYLEETRHYSKAITREERTKLEATQLALNNHHLSDSYLLARYLDGAGRSVWVGDDANDASLITLHANFEGTIARIVAEPAAEYAANRVLIVIDPAPAVKKPAPAQ